MIARGCVIFVILAKCVFSLPVSPSRVDHKDVKVIRCVVEVLTDALSKPQSVPVSPGCRETLMTDDRLVTILRHHNFLQELQDIASEGASERTAKRDEGGSNDESKQPKDQEAMADQSMLVAMERAGVGAEKRGAQENEERELESEESAGREEEPEEEEGDEEEEGKQVVTKKGENKEEQERRSSREGEEDEGAGLDVPGQHSETKEENRAEPAEKRRVVEDVGLKHWARARQLAHKRAEMSARSYEQQEAPHHSKEAPEAGEVVWKSPEEHDLQMMARRDPEDRRDEEGSAGKKTEEAEIDGLAAIESELEGVAQKLHQMRRG
ncbi:chromogranin-A isoform X2 [Brachyhypopomus gauderio]|uniref:chromogranin-A isoform X2 n=1 Tax=Brachyhypopomus gauderio TaxID=698409 RepID=UPI0040414321